MQLENSRYNKEVEKETALCNNLDEQIKHLRKEMETLSKAKEQAEKQNNLLQCKLSCVEKKLKEAEINTMNNDQELKKR